MSVSLTTFPLFCAVRDFIWRICSFSKSTGDAATLKKLAQIAVERGYGRFEWVCLKWNESAINFYKKLGATEMTEWTMFRVDGQSLLEMGKK